MEGNMQEYLTEKKAREKRLAVYTEKIQETVLNKSELTTLGADPNVESMKFFL